MGMKLPDTVSKKERSRIMSRVHDKNTVPEVKVRKALHAAGFRFRLHRKDIPGNPDIVLPRYSITVFVNGCFWHWHGCKRSRMPTSNIPYWEAKISRNVRRDKNVQSKLEEAGWESRIIWECELSDGTDSLINELNRIQR